MIVSIKNKDGEVLDYDISKIEDKSVKINASVGIQKVGTLEVVNEALRFAIDGHRVSLEKLLQNSPEAVVANDESEADKAED